MEPEFHYASGDITKLRIYTLSFEEFLEALDGELCQAWRRLPLPEAKDSCLEVYDRLRMAYDQYCQIGGYPKVVEAYLERRDILAARKELVRIIQIFLEESMRYFKDITDISVEIAEKTGASTATISRVNRSLNYGNDGYDLIFERLKSH